MAEYLSTRDPNEELFSYSDVLLNGLAQDGGLYIPTEYPQLDLKSLDGLPYTELFTRVKGVFIGDEIPAEVQAELSERAFSLDKFPHTKNGEVTPLLEIADDFFIQQLSLGPTAAFKDMALQPLGQDLQYVLGVRGERLPMLGATSGDTGSSAIRAVKGLGGISLAMLSPLTGMYEFQRAQMGEQTGDNITNMSVRGNFDACQDLVKAIKLDPEFSNLGAVNSINWGRVASQIPYYVSGYLQAVQGDIGREVDFVVPTGNFGNVLAGYIARKMGLPIRKLIIATNENDVLNRLIQTGTYHKPKDSEAIPTTSPSMDIMEGSNFERVLYDILGANPLAVNSYMKRFKDGEPVSFSDYGIVSSALLRLGFESGRSTEKDRIESVQWVFDRKSVVIDPHTADAITVARRKYDGKIPLVCMSTALPVKSEFFSQRALGFVPEREERFAGVEERSNDNAFIVVNNDAEEVKNVLRTTAVR